MGFNFFNVLSKNDKELVHSAFLHFLLTDDDTATYFKSALFPEFRFPIKKECVQLEKGYKRKKIDLEAFPENEEAILVVENKFKSFPYKEQLEIYAEIYQNRYPDKTIVKYLLCFDSEIIQLKQTSWHIISYKQFLETIRSLLAMDNEMNSVKKLFLIHYQNFLSGYFDRFQNILKSCGDLFNHPILKENKFWIRLIYSAIHVELIDYFESIGVEAHFAVNPGNISTPLLNIIPKKWNENGFPELLIQIQGNTFGLAL